jgi:Heparinase II/III N-terminus/Heparinase II/III-like protein
METIHSLQSCLQNLPVFFKKMNLGFRITMCKSLNYIPSNQPKIKLMKLLSISVVVLTVLITASCNSGSGTKDQKKQDVSYIKLTDDSQFFTLLNLNYPDMGEVKKYVKRGDIEKAKIAYLEFRREKSKVKWNINPADKPTKAASSDYPAAEKIMNHLIEPSMSAPEAFLGKKINWEFNPVDPKEPYFTKEWTWCNVNRMPFWNSLGRAYWSTLDEKYAKEWIDQVKSWVNDNPVPMAADPGATLTWRTIESGIRMAGSWMNAYYYFLTSPSLTPDAHLSFVKGVIEHGQRLEKITLDNPGRSGNWITMECNGLGTIGILFPELKKAEDYTRVAFDRLNTELDRQVYPDGAEVELTTSYHQVSRSNFMELAKLAQKNNIPLPVAYLDKLKKMYTFNLCLMDPTGILPPFNDASPTRTASSLREAYEIWKDPEFLFGATLGKEGTKPAYDSYYLNWAGYYAMRSGWKYEDNCLFFDAGPVGYGHEHEDMLNMYLYSHGKILLTEPGTYSYDLSEWRKYALSTSGHNTIIVDGKEQHRADIPSARLTKVPYDNPWVNSPLFDYGRGKYSSGYQVSKYVKVQFSPKEYVGPKDTTVSHTRHVIFLKPWYYIAVDFLQGTGIHTYEAHFHLDAPNAKMDKSTMAVQTLRTDSVQLGLYPMDGDKLEGKVVIGQVNPILGWMPHDMRKIPTIVYIKKGAAPSTFSTFLYPYLLEVPKISFSKTMTGNDDLWAENITTKYESASVIIRRKAARILSVINTGNTPAFSANADLIVIRKPNGKNETGIGFSGISEYKGDKISFVINEPSSVLMIKRENKTLFYNPQQNGVEVSFTAPLQQKIILPSNKWVEITSSGMIDSTEKITLF